jgi:hypothetical protein
MTCSRKYFKTYAIENTKDGDGLAFQYRLDDEALVVRFTLTPSARCRTAK